MKKGFMTTKGFILLPVILILTVIGTIALIMNQESLVAVKQVAKMTAVEEEQYSAEAGLVIAIKELEQDLDCTSYNIDDSGIFNEHDYQTNLSKDSGSPVIVSTHIDGNARSFSRQVTMYDVSSPGLLTLPASHGAYTKRSKPNNKFGNRTTIDVVYDGFLSERVGLVQFDLSGVSIPLENILSASLEMHLSGSPESNTVTVKVHRVTREWHQDQVTHNDRLTGISWTPVFSIDFSKEDDTVVNENNIDWYSWDLTEVLHQWMDGTHTNYGVMLLGDVFNSNNLKFISDSNSDTAKRPRLIITYLCECGAVCS